MRKVLLIASVVIFTISSVFAADGTIHLIYTNGSTITEDNTTYFEFDIKAWLSGGSEVLRCGMAYVEYPETLFGEKVVYNKKVEAVKSGILKNYTDTELSVKLYDIIKNDTRINCFAVTFEASSGNKNYYETISTDESSPSDLLRIRIEAAAEGSGSVFFPDDIPGSDDLFYNFESVTFSGGLDYSEAAEPVSIEFPDEHDIDLKNFLAKWEKGELNIKWFVKDEMNIAGYILKRSENGGEFVEVSSYESNDALCAASNTNGVQKYDYTDPAAIPGTDYIYQLEYADINGNIISLYTEEVTDKWNYSMKEGFPNPFNPSFIVPFELYDTRDINIKLYDINGKCVRDIASGTYSAGNYEINVDCSDLSSGVYILRSDMSGKIETQRMLLVK